MNESNPRPRFQRPSFRDLFYLSAGIIIGCYGKELVTEVVTKYLGV